MNTTCSVVTRHRQDLLLESISVIRWVGLFGDTTEVFNDHKDVLGDPDTAMKFSLLGVQPGNKGFSMTEPHQHR